VASWLLVTAAVKESARGGKIRYPPLAENGIRGMTDRVSKHDIAKPKEYQRASYVDAAGIEGRKMLLPGEIL